MALEMISLKSQREIEAMRRAGRITAQARALAGSMVKPGVTTHRSIPRCAALSKVMERSPLFWAMPDILVLPVSR